MKKFKVALQLYSVRDQMEKDFVGTLQAVKDMGYDYVEFAGFFDKSAREVRAILDEIGLTAISVHQGNQLFLEQGERAINYLKTVGVRYCAIPWFEQQRLLADWSGTLGEFSEYSAALKKAGIKLLYHNHDFEFTVVENEYIIDRLYSQLGADVINPEFDVCWVHYAGEDPAKYVAKYSGRVDVLHLKDYVGSPKGGSVYALIDKDGKEQKSEKTNTEFRFVPLGMGVQNFEQILAAAEEAGTEFVVVEQDQSVDRPTLEAAKISREYLAKLGL